MAVGDRVKIWEAIVKLKSGQVYKCFLCSQLFYTLQSFANHLSNFHNLQKDSQYTCMHCEGIFNRKSFMNHYRNIFKFHKNLLKHNLLTEVECEVVREAEATIVESSQEKINEQFKLLNIIHLQKSLAKLVGSIYASGKIPMSTSDTILCNVKNLVKELVTQVVSVLISVDNLNISSELKKIVMQLNKVSQIFDPFESKYKLDKFLVQNNYMIPSKEIVLDSDIYFRRQGTGTQDQVYRPIVMQYISIKQTLLQLLSKRGFFYSLDLEKKYNGEVFSNFREGKYYKISCFPKNTLFINLYYDDAEVANPLGSKSGKHKLANFYYTLLDMPRHSSSSTDNILLLASLKSQDMKLSGANAVVNVIIKELKDLWKTGIDFMLDGKSLNIKVAVAQICGDNLGLNSLLGFSEGFMANYYCRRCKSHRNNSQVETVENGPLLRNVENYNVDLLTKNLSLTGLNFESIFNTLPYFHVTKNYVFDIMHDLLEGSVPDLIPLFLNYGIQKKLFTFDQINYRLEAFDYGKHFTNTKPTLLKYHNLKAGKLGQNASQNLCLILHLPLILSDLVTEDDETLSLVHILRDIVIISLADKITKSGLQQLSCIISEYCHRYQSLFSKHLKPKHHHLLHYASSIEEIGPLKQFWSMSFESNHKFFKVVAHSMGNFRNISKSVTYRHQLSRCFSLLSRDSYKTFWQEIPNYDTVKISTLSRSVLVADYYFKRLNDTIRVTNFMTHNGCDYRVGCFVLLDYCNISPNFGQIEQIYYLEDDSLNLLVVEYSGLFIEHLDVYKIECTNIVKIVDINTLDFYLPLYSISSCKLNDVDKYLIVPVKYI